MEIFGNTRGLQPSDLRTLERLYRRRVPFDTLTTPELTRSLVEASHATRRQIGVLVNREGTVEWVIVGDAAKLLLPNLGRLRAAPGRFRGLRLIHTHLRHEPLTRDDLVDLTRLRLDLVAAICISQQGRPTSVYYGYNVPLAEGAQGEPFRTHGPIPYGQVDVHPERLVLALEQEFARAARTRLVRAKEGRAILVHACAKTHAGRSEESLRELKELARTAGVEVADTVLQVRDRVDPKYVLGKGRLEEVVIRAMQLDAELLVFDCNLSPAQATAIAAVTDLKVIDRSQLILDIFAQRAETRDGKLQVELAQMSYLLPRLGTRDDALSRLTGGIGGRGPGETKLEIGRRRARERISRLQAELKLLAKQRKQRRTQRGRSGIPVIALVGYTNAGKTTLINALTGADLLAEDKLFATLDTRSRRLRLPSGKEAVLTDTVGFIRDLPEDLFAAFRSTFEEAKDAQLLLHVVDLSDPDYDNHLRTTEKVLIELELGRVARLIVLNKADRVPAEHAQALARASGGIAVSALEPSTLRALVTRIEGMLEASPLDATLPSYETRTPSFDERPSVS